MPVHILNEGTAITHLRSLLPCGQLRGEILYPAPHRLLPNNTKASRTKSLPAAWNLPEKFHAAGSDFVRDAFDLRGGAALVLAGLLANGNTEISGIEHIQRGYEDFIPKLTSLGAKIKIK